MVWSDVIQLAKSDVRACRGVQRPTVLRCWAHVNLFKMRVLRRGGPCSTRTASPAACRLPPRPARVAVGLGAAMCAAQSCPCRLVGVAARCTCPRWGESMLCVYCTPRSSNLQGSRGEISRGPLFRLSFAVSRISPHFRPVTASVADADCGFSAPPASTPARPSPEARSRTAAARARGPRPEAQAERG